MKVAAMARSGLNSGATFPLSFRLRRLVWIMCWAALCSWTPPQLRAWRRLVLRLFGARIHPSANVRSSAKVWYPPNLIMGAGSSLGPRVDCYNVDRIEIGERVVISQDAYLCSASHDIADPAFLLKTRPITIGSHAWIAAGSFVGPGVEVGAGAVLAARGAAFGPLDPWTVYRGNPAVAIKRRPTVG